MIGDQVAAERVGLLLLALAFLWGFVQAAAGGPPAP